MESGLNPVELARELRSVLARNAAEAERNRRLPEENIETLEKANLFKVMTPKRWGSRGAPLTTSLQTFAELAKGCGSIGVGRNDHQRRRMVGQPSVGRRAGGDLRQVAGPHMRGGDTGSQG